MREKLARALGLAGFLTIVGGAGSYELGGTVTTYLCTSAAGVAMIAVSAFWYEMQAVKAERHMKRLKHRRVRQDEDGTKRRPDSY